MIQCKGKELKRAVKLAAAVAPGKSTLPLLSSVALVTSGPGGVYVVGTDLDTWVRIWVSGVHSGDAPERTCVLPRREILAAFKGVPFELEIRISPGFAEVNGARIAECCEEDQYPPFPDFEVGPTCRLPDPAQFVRTLRVLTPALPTDYTRSERQHVWMELSGDLATLTATNGHILHTVTIGGANCDEEWPSRGTLLPYALVRAALKADFEVGADISIRLGKTYIAVSCGRILIVGRRPEGEFPPYRQAFPKKRRAILELSRSEFSNACKYLVGFTEPATRALEIRVNPESNGTAAVVLTARRQGTAATRVLSGVMVTKCHPISFGVNAAHLLNALNVGSGETVELDYGEPDAPIWLPGAYAEALLMPLRLPEQPTEE